MRHLELTSLLILINTRENIKGLNSRILFFWNCWALPDLLNTALMILCFQRRRSWQTVWSFARFVCCPSDYLHSSKKKQKGKNATSLMMKEALKHIGQPGMNRVLVMFSAIWKAPLMLWSDSQQFRLSLLGAKNWIAQVSEKWELICIVQRHLPIPFI